MINDPKDISEIIDTLDNLSFEQLDEAIRRADEMNEEENKLKNIEEILELCREERPYNQDVSAELDNDDLESLDYLYTQYKKEKEENKRLRDLYLRISRHQIDIGHVELGEYMLAQINGCPTWVVTDM